MYGRIRSAWKVDGDLLRYEASVPGNTTATLYLPAPSEEVVREGGGDASRARGVTFLEYEDGRAVYELAAGSYDFTVVRGKHRHPADTR
jgi:alpha-L-rhamnosidase